MDPDSHPGQRATGAGGAPDLRRPSQRLKAPPPGTSSRQPHSAHQRLTRAHAVGRVMGPHAHTSGTQDTQIAEPQLPAPEDGRPRGGRRLAPDAPHSGGRPPPSGTAPTSPAARSPHRARKPRGQCWAPTPAHPHPQHVGSGPQQPAQRAGSRGRGGNALPQTSLATAQGTPPRGRPSASPAARNDSSQGRTL